MIQRPHSISYLITIIGIHFCYILANGQPGLLFKNNDPLNITLTGNIRELLKDRGNDPQYHPITLSYRTSDSSLISLSIKAKVRGHFRKARENCTIPPLLLKFSKDASPDISIFSGQDKIKLVTPCQGDRYVVKEYLVYKLYNLVTPKSFEARLVKVILNDTVKSMNKSFYGMLLEDEDEMAKRNNALATDGRLVRPEQTQKNDFLKMAVFQYMIGNTDWSVQYMQNIKFIAADSSGALSPVPYDFDHAGIVGAPYAKPAEKLLLTSTRERRYRGYCIADMREFDETFDLFRKLEKEFSAVYTECLLLEKGYIKSTTRYLDQFYSTINDPGHAKAAFGYPCDKAGTGNVVIKGLKKN